MIPYEMIIIDIISSIAQLIYKNIDYIDKKLKKKR